MPLILKCLLFLLTVALLNGDNPTSIIPAYSGPDPGYIIAESTSGLANRLRVMGAYMHVADYKYNGAHLVFVWEVTEACPGHFLSIFEPIPKLVFATNSSRYVLDKHAKVNYENSFAVFSWIMKMNDIPRNRFGLPSWGEIEYLMHSKYFPTREIMFKVLSFVHVHQICNASAMHIRETDMKESILKTSHGRKKFSLQPFINFVESRPKEEKIFLLTDNPLTQQFFLKEYPTQIVIYSSMEIDLINQLPMKIKNMKDIDHLLPLIGRKVQKLSADPTNKLNNNNNNSSSLASDHRYTTLENTIIDVLIAAHAKNFKASAFSSLSELVMMFNKIGRKDRGWCQ
jgi:hypothetical protein